MTCFAIYCSDYDIFYYEHAPDASFCKNCDTYIGKSAYIPKSLGISRFPKDFCFSYDGQLLLSKNAKEFLLESADTKVDFLKVNDMPDVFVPIISEVVEFDYKRRGTRFLDYCDFCNNYESIVGAAPPFLKSPENVLAKGIYISDLKFGSGREKGPIYIVGVQLGKLLKKSFREIDLEVVKS